MPSRSRSDLPRLSGRPDDAVPQNPRETTRVFRRFFDLLERLEKPAGAARPPTAKASREPARGGRR